MLNQKFIISIISLFFLASCETATQNAIKSTTEKAGKTAKAASGSELQPNNFLIQLGACFLFPLLLFFDRNKDD